MALYNHIEREGLADELWQTKQPRIYDREVRDVWEVETPEQETRRSRDASFHVLHWSYRSLSKLRYLRHFAR